MDRSHWAGGFAETSIELAEEELDMTKTDIGQALGADRKTLDRWIRRQSSPSPKYRKNLEDLNHLRFLLNESFRSADNRLEWLHTPSRAFQGRTPFDTIRKGKLSDVVDYLATLASGAHL